jgi:hypothetical protein
MKVHLGIDPDFRPAKRAHPDFLVTDLDALSEKFLKAGISFQSASPVEGKA